MPPRREGQVEIEVFPLHLATESNVRVSTQTVVQALSALLFRYEEVLELEVSCLDDLVRGKEPVRLPTVLAQ